MKIEEYLVESSDTEIGQLAADGAALDLIEKMGLTGQKKLASATATRNVFRRMTALEQLVFETLFTVKTKLPDFEHEIIPLRVLELAQRAIQGGFFVRIEVWHNPEMVDPVLVGTAGTLKNESWGEYVTNHAHFLIARWGEALDSFEQLTAKARDAWCAERAGRAKRAVTKNQNVLATLKEDAMLAFTTGKTPTENPD